MTRYLKSKYTGVFSQPSTARKHQGRPDLAWYIVYQLDGKRKWEKVGWTSEGYTAALANQIRAERVRGVRGHEAVVGRDLTMDQAWSLAWDRHVKHLGRAYNDLKCYEAHLGPALGSLALSAIKSADLESIRDGLQAKGRAAATIRHVIGLVGRIYNYLIKWELYQGGNPAARVMLPKEDNRRFRFLTPGEAAALLERLKARSEHVYCLAMMSLYTGMRSGEIMRMRGEHVDLANAQAWATKTKNKVDRAVYLPGPVLEMLRQREIKPGQLVFLRPKGGTYERVSHVFDRTVKELRLNDGRTDRRDRVVFHTLRHTFASGQVIQGQSLYMVGTLLGHKSPQMTQRYAHLAPEAQKAAVLAIENFLNNHD